MTDDTQPERIPPHNGHGAVATAFADDEWLQVAEQVAALTPERAEALRLYLRMRGVEFPGLERIAKASAQSSCQSP